VFITAPRGQRDLLATLFQARQAIFVQLADAPWA
jgi:hypothetical protein